MIKYMSIMQQISEAEDELVKLLISMLLGAIIGWQREYTGHEAGIRTFSSICMGSCLFGIISYSIAFPGDPGRIAAQVASGIGFIGVGVIIRDGGSIKGLTTAATLWAMAAIGLGVAYGLYVLAFLATCLIFVSLFISRTRWWHLIPRGTTEHSRDHPEITDHSFPLQKNNSNGSHDINTNVGKQGHGMEKKD